MRVRSISHRLVLAVAVSAATIACMSSPLQPGASDVESPRATQGQEPAVTTITPTSGPVGTRVTVTGSGFASRSNTATFGQGYIRDLESTDGTTLSFTVPEGLDLCSPDATGPCAGAHPRTRAGDYVVAVMREGRKSNTLTFTVTP